ncbi:MAG: PRD domain-containing protein, partial [Erysipelotrichaceae bacterium]|nr:PRD domain-containing protein [Erysipelotrichaceae bacterium]
RLSEGQLIESENQTIFEELKKSYPDSYACSLKIADYLNRELHKQINDEEILYLVIHINRLISRIEE